MTRMVCATLLLAIVVISSWAAWLDLRNARLASALEIERARRYVDDPECDGIREQVERREFVGTLQAAVHLYERYTPRDE